MRKITVTILVGFICLFFNTSLFAKIDINTASITELQELPRIGPSLAQAIIDYRESINGFKTIQEIKNVPRIGQKTFEGFKDKITVGDVRKPEPGEMRKPTVIPVEESSEMRYEPIIKMTPTPTSTPVPSVDEIMSQFADEPTIHDVHRAAIVYAGISQDRFIQWRRDVKKRALYPDTFQMKVGHDTDDDTDYSRGKSISLSGGTVTIGPDDETWEHDTDYDWDYEVKLKWNFQDYIFHPDMLRISSETEDQVELRQDILNEVTQLYYERRRMQVTMILEPNVSIQTRIKQLMKIQELTAALDGLTDGIFLKNINNCR